MDSKEAIIHHGIRMFLERGYEGFSMRDLSVAVGIRQPSVYYHFKDKRALFSVCAQSFFNAWYVWLEQNIPKDTDLKTFIHATCQSLGDTRGLVEVLYGATTTTGQYQLVLDVLRYAPEAMDNMYRFNQAYFALLERHVAQAKREGVIRAGVTADSIYTLLSALMEGTGLLAVLEPAMPLKAEEDAMFQIVWRGIAAGV